MYDDAGSILLSSFGAIAALSSFAALIWAAVWDGRDEQAFRDSGRRSSP
jgi:hypothetical protein